ncbi:GlsB/YeaQ/YmgE family stress response membrane protein [Streptomyces axinellae]|uniref:GlsB/YeaQ/YmgE family stress response membrane protein n=1 Tax=Streptomyces axinellae TaxID=552788 RepID=A0ABP6BZS9_9ACTN
MDISGIVSAVIIGLVIGALGRLVLPGRQNVGLLWTLVVGIVAALVGTAIAGAVGVADTRGIDWIELAIQVALAAVGVGILDGAKARGRSERRR